MARKQPPVMTFEQASQIHLLDLKAANRTNERIQYVEKAHRRFLEFLRERRPALGEHPPITALTLEHAREFTLWLKDSHRSRNALTGSTVEKGASTIRAHVIDLRALGRFCSDEGLLPTHPLARLKIPTVETRVIEVFQSHHLRAMLQVIDGHLMRNRDRVLVFVLLSTGVRASELCALTLSGVDIRSRTLKVLGKGRKERLVRFDAATGKLLAKYIVTLGDQRPQARLFVTRYGKPLTRIALYRMIAKVGEDAAITDVRVSPHTFRHTFATQFLRSHPGALFHLMELLGHTNLAMVRRYAKISQAEANLDGPSTVEAFGLDQMARRWGQ